MTERLTAAKGHFLLRSLPFGGARSWPLLLLLVVVIVPTVGVLWFMMVAMDNERMAVRQRLITAYRTQLAGVKSQLAASLQQQAAKLDGRAAGASCAAVFAAVVLAGEADSLICAGTAPGTDYPAYPTTPSSSREKRSGAWRAAARLERRGAFGRAAEAFSRIARHSLGDHSLGDHRLGDHRPDDHRPDDTRAARALQAQARCLSRAGRPDSALRVLREELSQPRYRSAVDPRGRLIAANALLLGLQLIDPQDQAFHPAADALRERLNDYGEPVLPAPQRRFLMRELRAAQPAAPGFDTLAAEDLAADFLATSRSPPSGPEEPAAPPPSTPSRSGLDGLWQLASPSGKVVSLHTETGLRERLARTLAGMALPSETTAEILQPGLDPDPEAIFVRFAADEPLAGWRLALPLDEQTQVDAAARRQITVYLWTGILVIVLIVAATSVIARAVGGQIRSTRLKNDLLANVSHELKTPLASMRLLVDTLLEGPSRDPRHVREYLELISQENSRLSRLVDNFLSFSRIECGKQTFERQEITAGSVVSAATATVGERFDAPGCRLDVEVAPGLPRIYADPDAMVTVILNLLDNAYKYSGGDKRIALSAGAEGGDVSFAVRDNGIGLSSRERKKVFERFWQADQDLTRHASGCGLGLSIVSYIVRAHGGRVEVTSRPREGSTFTVRLPAVDVPAGGATAGGATAGGATAGGATAGGASHVARPDQNPREGMEG